jgi:hypothetical protein
LDPCVYEVFDSESALELNPEVVTLTPGTPCRGSTVFSETSEHSNEPEFDNLRAIYHGSPKTFADSATSEIRESRAFSPLQPSAEASGGRREDGGREGYEVEKV